MKKFFLGTMFLILAMIVPMSAMARVDIHVSIPLPPPVLFSVPPVAVVIPDTYVYVFPDVRENIFFYNGWWWRSWEGRWYRSQHYNSGWVHYQNVPSFYSRIPANWRNDYRDRRWNSHQWNYQRIPEKQLQNNWRSWERNKYWEKQNTWGVKGLRSQPQPSKASPYREIKPGQSRPQSQVVQPRHSQTQFRQVQPGREVKPQSHPQSSQQDQPQGNHGRGGYDRQERR